MSRAPIRFPGRGRPLDRRVLIGWAVLAFGLLLLLANTLYVVEQREQAIVVRFGEPVRTVNAGPGGSPGLKVKAPFVENVLFYDKRILKHETEQEEIIAADQERLVVDAFVRYRIVDPVRFYTTLRNQTQAEDRIERLVNSALRQVLGSVPSNDIISGRRAELMQATQRDVNARTRAARFGVEVIDVRIKRADLPQANQQAVFRRMQTSRQQQAAQIRATGEQQKREIMAGADKEVAITLATAQQYAGQVQGEGDARAASIFAASYGRDPSFAAFYRSMQAYERALAGGDTTMVLSPDSDFFRYFEGGPSGGR
jgi:modulator of FtsH protease HflC